MKKRIWIPTILCALLALAIAWGTPLNGGDADCSGTNNVSDLTYMVDYLFKGGPAPCAIGALGTPIAAGIIGPDAEITNGTGNFTCTWNATHSRYDIVIDGESYWYTNYITHVTPLNAIAFANTASSSSTLVVKLYSTSGTLVQGYFAFTTYKVPVIREIPDIPADQVRPEPN